MNASGNNIDSLKKKRKEYALNMNFVLNLRLKQELSQIEKQIYDLERTYLEVNCNLFCFMLILAFQLFVPFIMQLLLFFSFEPFKTIE